MAETSYNSIVDNIRNWPLSRKLALAGITLLCAVLFGLLIFQARQAEYRPLYTELPRQEAASVTAWLKENGVPYQLENAGRSIYVPADMVYDTRLNLAGAGLPRQGGVGFEIFDKQNFGVTKFTQKVNFQRAMQGELARTISALEPVKSSRVHLVLPEDRLLQEQQEPAKASVVVDLATGGGLGSGQTQAIIHMVAGSIEGLDKGRVTVIDTRGRVLSESKGQQPAMAMLPDKLKFKNTLETRLEDRAQSLLDRALGRGNSVVRVNADLDFTQEEVTSEEYDPDSLVPRSEKITESESGRKQTGGVPGTASNLGEAEQTGGSVASTKSSEVVNYEISKTVKQVKRPVGEVRNISAAVLVADQFKAGAKGEDGSYVPLSDQKIASIRKMVISAIGLDTGSGDRIEVVSMPFKKEVLNAGVSETEPGIYDYLPYFKYLLVLVCALLVYLFLLRPVIKTLRGETASYRESSWPELAYESEEEGPRALDSPARLRKELENSSVTPAQVVRTWLKEGGTG